MADRERKLKLAQARLKLQQLQQPDTFDEGTLTEFEKMFDAAQSGDIGEFLKTAVTEFPVAGSLNLRRGGRILKKGGQELGAAATALGTEEGRQKLREGASQFYETAKADPGGTASAVGQGFLEQGKKVVTDPWGTIEESPLSELVLPGAGKLNPLRFIPGGFGGLAKTGARTAREVGVTGAGLLSRTGREPLTQTFKAAERGGPSRELLTSARRGKISAPEIRDIVVDAATKAKKQASDAFAAGRAKIVEAFPDRRPDMMENIQEGLQEVLKKFKVSRKQVETTRRRAGFTGGETTTTKSRLGFDDFQSDADIDIGVVESVVKLVETRARKGLDTADDLITMRQKIDSIVDYGPLVVGGDVGEAFAKQVRDAVDKQVKRIPGMPELDAKFGIRSKLLQELKTGLVGAENNETITRKLIQAMKDNIGEKERLLDAAQQFSTTDLFALSAGLATREKMPQSIIALGGAVTATAINPAMVFAIPFTIPRLAGEFVAAAGGLKGDVVRTVKAFTDITRLAKVANIATEGLTLGMVIQRLHEQGKGSDIAGELQGRLRSRRLSEENTPDFSGLQRQR
jgi:hypothetical protein